LSAEYHYYSCSILKKDGSGSFLTQEIHLRGHNPTRILPVDLYGDNCLDVAALNNGGGVCIGMAE